MENDYCYDETRINEGRKEIGKEAALLLFGNNLIFNEQGQRALIDLGKAIEDLGIRGIETQKGSS